MLKTPYKIAVVIPKYGLLGGAEGFAAKLTERIAKYEQFNVHVFASQWQSTSKLIRFHHVPIITFPKFLSTISFAYFAQRKMAQMKVDIIHSHERIFNANIFTMHGIPHRLWVNEVRKKRMSLFDFSTEWVERKLVMHKKIKKFLTVSNLAKEKFLQEYPHIDPCLVEVIHPGVDSTRFEGHNRRLCRQEIRKNFGINTKDIIILFVSMNFHIKGLDRVILGLSKLKSNNTNGKYKLLVVGKDQVRRYKKMAYDLGVEENIIFSGPVQENILEKIYLASDIFAMPSRFDTFGIAALEAMAASLPVIISSNVGAKDVVKENIDGFILRSDNPEEIAEKLRLLSVEKVRVSMGENARITSKNHSWEITAQKVLKVYDEML
jgi:UDP-glucose:(heptosyl)LPS alpha-1,3-glucosyltransferase